MEHGGFEVIASEDVQLGTFRFRYGPAVMAITAGGEHPYRPALVMEGICPKHETPLERRDDCGWCDECGSGYSASSSGGDTTLSVHFEIAGFEIDPPTT